MKKQIGRMAIVLALALWGAAAVSAAVTGMRVEHLANPLGIDVESPRFSWQMATDIRQHGQRQTAWRIVVTDDAGQTVWNSGRRKDGGSLGIAYGGMALRPTTRYSWQLEVWDEKGRKSVGKSWFETGLMGGANWSGAKWIGGTEADIPFYAHYLPVFGISFTVTLDKGTDTRRAAFVYGANDARLMDRNMNILGVEAAHGESYVKIELDATADTARLNVYRSGYSKGDNAEKALRSFNIPTNLINPANRFAPHTISLTSVLGTTRFKVDGSPRELGRVELNPMGRGGDYIAFPVVADYGFVASAGGKARFSDVVVRNYRSPGNVIATLAADTTVAGAALQTRAAAVKPAPVLRTEFAAGKAISKARLYATARGIYSFYINGRKVGGEWFAPGFTQYNKTHYYQTYDVTDMLRTGSNAMGAMLAEGWWSGGMTFTGENWNFFGDRQSLLAKLVISYADGSADTIVTSPQGWSYCPAGHILEASMFQGEVYDAVRAARMAGWSSPGYDASGWHGASEVPVAGTTSTSGSDNMPHVSDFSQLVLTGRNDTGVRAVDTLTAQSVEEVRPGVFVYDMGQNMAGVPEIQLRGLRPGTRVTMRFAEVRYPDLDRYAGNSGMIMLENIRAAMARDIYIARGGHEVFRPEFTYHGYRYVEITGVDRQLPPADVRGIVLSSAGRAEAHYETSDTLVNRLWQNIGWSMRANFFSVPTDCPQRNERMGWAGDISVFSPTATYLGHVPRFLDNYVQAMRDVQHPNGKFLDIAPVGGGFGGILWGSAGITVPWQSYLQYADTAMLAKNYKAMSMYIDFILANTLDPNTGIIVQDRAWGDLADWLGPEDGLNDRSLLWEAYFIYDLDIMARVAGILGHEADVARFGGIAAERRRLFNRTYIHPVTAKTIWSDFNPEKRGSIVGTQTSYVLPLAFGIVADSLRSRFMANLEATITSPQGGYKPYSLLTGFIGTAWVSNVLSDNGRSDLAYRMLLSRDYPSWLYSVTQGATTIWERLNSYTHKDGFGKNNRMNSFNHYSFGAVGEWMISRSLGIRRDEGSPGFAHFLLAPEPDPTGQLTYSRGYYNSMYGRIESGWQRNGDATTYTFTVPANTSATLRIKGNVAKGSMKGVKKVREDNGVTEMELTSGRYVFQGDVSKCGE